MNTIETNTQNTIIISKSKFICLLIKIDNDKLLDTTLNNIKKEYKDATHYCYGYIIDNVKRFSDDSEPNGTAGMPILNVLENNNLNHILCVVIRYFGGIKLGTGGLVRAYTNSVVEALKKSNIITLLKGKKVKLTFNYDNTKEIDYILSNITNIKKNYELYITYVFEISDLEFDKYKDKLKELCINIEIIADIYT